MSTPNFPPYTAVYGCGNDGPGAKNMLYWLDKESPWAGIAYNLGVCACRGTGAGSTSQHARCRAWDLGLPMVNGKANPVGWDIINFLLPLVDELGITELIWSRRRWSRQAPNGRYYTGVSPHYDHIHAAHTLTATRLLNVPTIRAVTSGARPPVVVRPPAQTPDPDPIPEPEDDDVLTLKLHHDLSWWLYSGLFRMQVTTDADAVAWRDTLSALGRFEDLRNNRAASERWFRATVPASDLTKIVALTQATWNQVAPAR